MISSYTFVVESVSELKAELAKALVSVKFEPVLAFGFVSVNMPITKFMDVFESYDILLFGVTGGGEILFDKQQDKLISNGAVFVLTDLKPDVFKRYFINRNGINNYTFGKLIGEKIKASFQNPSVILATSGLSLDGQAMLDGVLDVAGSNISLYGGMAADDGMFSKTFVFTEANISDDGALALVFDGSAIELRGLSTSGWMSLGSEFVVNHSEGNVVYEINGQPALDMYIDYLNVTEEDLPGIGLEYPFMLKQGEDEIVIRAVMQVDTEKRALIFAGSVPQGSVISFSSSPGFEIMENTRNKIIDFHTLYPEADLMLLFSCVARHVALGPLISTEIKLASIKWKVPLLGFFSFGEFGSNEGRSCQLNNQTFTLALIRDKT